MGDYQKWWFSGNRKDEEEGPTTIEINRRRGDQREKRYIGTATCLLEREWNDWYPMTHQKKLHTVFIVKYKKDTRTRREGIGWLLLVMLKMRWLKQFLDEKKTNPEKLRGEMVAEGVFKAEPGLLCCKLWKNTNGYKTEERDDWIWSEQNREVRKLTV